jgi:hypothetical protein
VPSPVFAVFAASLFALNVALPPSAGAQKHALIVSVADAASGKPLEGAQVRLPETGRLARADWIGEVKFSDVSAGTHVVRVRMVGYAPAEIKVLVAGDSTGAVFMLEQTAMATDTVRVAAVPKSTTPKLFEFESHRTMGIARILSDSVLGKVERDQLSLTLATHFPGLFIVHLVGGHSTVKTFRQSGDLKGSECGVRMYLDGIAMGQDLFETLDPRDLAGVEYYPIASAPAQYRIAAPPVPNGLAACVVLLFWTK